MKTDNSNVEVGPVVIEYPFYLQHMTNYNLFKICSENEALKIERHSYIIDPIEASQIIHLRKMEKALKTRGILLEIKLVEVTAQDFNDKHDAIQDQINKRLIKSKE